MFRYEILINAFNTADLEEETAKMRITEEEAKEQELSFCLSLGSLGLSFELLIWSQFEITLYMMMQGLKSSRLSLC